jgi:hypothetical protein
MTARHTTRAAMMAPRRACLGAALVQEGREADVGASGRAVSAGASRKQQCGLAAYPTDLTPADISDSACYRHRCAYPPNTLLMVDRLVQEPFLVEVQAVAAL